MAPPIVPRSPDSRRGGTDHGRMTRGRSPGWRLGHRPALDGVRGIAILLVLAGHVLSPYYTNAGQVGVTVFFTLSGFLITTLLCETRERTGGFALGSFYTARALRLLPALVAVVAACVLVSLLAGRAFVTGGDVARALLYGTNLSSHGMLAHRPNLLHHTWSLAVEEQFYVVFPLLLVALSRRRRLLCVLLVVVTLAVQPWRVWLALDGRHFAHLLFGTDTRGDAILVGCLLALLLQAVPPMPLSRVTTVVALVLVLALGELPATAGVLVVTSVVPLLTCVLVLATLGGAAPRVLATPGLVFVGRRSYGLYLWQHPVLMLSDTLLGLTDQPLRTALVVVPVSFALTLLSWRYVEEPFLRLKRRRATAGPARSLRSEPSPAA
jgi:peptidoglycan/LPS O-acetylase OafA/YrhL